MSRWSTSSKLTADTITDEHIATLRSQLLGKSLAIVPPLDTDDHALLRWTSLAVGDGAMPTQKYEARGVCAMAINSGKYPKRFKLPLGMLTMGAACLDDNAAFSRLEHGRHWVRGTYDDLLEVLYYIESCPAALGLDGADPSERRAALNTIKTWRSKLSLDANYKTPIPESATTP